MLAMTPGTRIDFAAWARTKDPKKHYRWLDSEKCACAQYYCERGMWTSGSHWGGQPGAHDLNALAELVPVKRGGWSSFGDLVELLEAAMSEAARLA